MKVSRRNLLVGGIGVPLALGGVLAADRFGCLPVTGWLPVNGRPVQFEIEPLTDETAVSNGSPITSRIALSRLCSMKDLGPADVMHLARMLITGERCGLTFLSLSSKELCTIFLDDSQVKSYFGVQSGIFVPRGTYFEVKKAAVVSPISYVSESHLDYLLFTMAECGISLDTDSSICGRASAKPLRSRFDRIVGDIKRALEGDEFSLTVSSLLLYRGATVVNCEFVAERLIRSKERFCYDLHRFYAISALVQMKCLSRRMQSNLEAELERKSKTMLESQGEDGAWRNERGRDSLVITSHQLEWWYLLFGKSEVIEKSISRSINYLAGKLQLASNEELKKHFSTWCHVARCLIIDDWRRGHVYL